MNTARNSQFQSILICLALALATAFAYWPVRHHGFIRFDDEGYVAENYVVQQGLTQQGVAWAFVPGHAANWHPLTWLSHMLDCELFGVKPGAHHLVNLLFHIVNAVLLFLLFRKITGALWRSAFVAALFALHPLHVESVAWISERKDVLSTFFGLLTIWFYARYVQSQKSKAQSPKFGGGMRWYGLSLFFFALGLMSKPMLVTFPFVLLLLDFWPLNRLKFSPFEIRNLKFVIFEKLPFLALTAVSSVLTFLAQQNSGAMATLDQLILSHRIRNAFVAYIGYLGKMFWPAKLAILYPIQVWPLWMVICSALLLVFLSAAAFKLATRRPYILVGWLWYLGMLVPVIGLVHVGSQWMADRYTYLPLIGIFVILAWGGYDLLRFPKLRAALGVVTIALSLVLTRHQVVLWRDSETLFKHALRFTQKNVVIQNNLAAEYVVQGRLDDAIVLLNEALSHNPNLANTLANLGSALERQGKIEEAMSKYVRATELNPKNPEAQNNLGFLLLMRGDFQNAIQRFKLALKYRVEFPEPYYNLGNAYFMQGDLMKALSHYESAAKYNPDYAEARSNLGYTLLKLGQSAAALPHLEAAVNLKPDYAQAHNNLAEAFSRLGKFAEAETHSRRAVQLQPDSATFQDVFGLALAAQKKWLEAVAAFSRAVELKPSAEFHFHLANSFLALNRVQDAKTHYLSALQLQSEYPEAEMQLAMLFLREKNRAEAVAHLRNIAEQRPQWKEPINNLAWLLATSTDAKVRDATGALTWALQTVRVSPTNDFSALDTLAAAYAESNQFEPARSNAEKALEGARRAGDTNSAAQISARLELYRKSQPYRE